MFVRGCCCIPDTIESILALQTPLQQITVGSGRRLNTQTQSTVGSGRRLNTQTQSTVGSGRRLNIQTQSTVGSDRGFKKQHESDLVQWKHKKSNLVRLVYSRAQALDSIHKFCKYVTQRIRQIHSVFAVFPNIYIYLLECK